MIRRFAAVALALALTFPVSARDSLGVYAQWAAFRDPQVPRCYAIAASTKESETRGYASVGTWPARNVRGQFHMRLSLGVSGQTRVRLAIGKERFDLTARANDAWAKDKRMDAAIIAAMRSATRMSVSARSAAGVRFTDRYSLEGAATAIDAAVVGCASL
ncbi:MAG: invasion associated locus B family protein [Pseudomonadota bacterium]